jgi:Flp pilus assembly protein TadD
MAAWDADDLTVRKKLARMAKAAGDTDGVIRWATEVLHVDVQDVEAHRLLAEAFAGRHDDRKALEEFEVAVRLEPDDAPLRLALAETLVRLGEKDRARVALEELMEMTPDDPRVKTLLESLNP